MVVEKTCQGERAWTYCSLHPDARAAWSCNKCGRFLCPACAVSDWRGNQEYARCKACNTTAEQLLVPREQRPYWDLFPTFVKAIFCPWGIAQVLILALFFVIIDFIIFPIGYVFSYSILAGVMFLIINKGSMGRIEPPDVPDFKLGLAREADLLVPEMPEARPLGSVYVPEPEPGDGSDRENLGLAVELWFALERGDDTASMRIFQQLTAAGLAPDLSFELELRLANLLERYDDALNAARAFHRAAQKDLQRPEAPSAILSAARLLLEKTDKLEVGEKLLRYLVQSYPGHDAAQRALVMLRNAPK